MSRKNSSFDTAELEGDGLSRFDSEETVSATYDDEFGIQLSEEDAFAI